MNVKRLLELEVTSASIEKMIVSVQLAGESDPGYEEWARLLVGKKGVGEFYPEDCDGFVTVWFENEGYVGLELELVRVIRWLS